MDNSQVPPMGGHIITVRIHNGNNYVCADVLQMINQAGLPGPAKTAIHGSFRIIGIPDVACSGLTPEQIPESNGKK